METPGKIAPAAERAQTKCKAEISNRQVLQDGMIAELLKDP